ncbi:MAG: hypothetical protein ACK5W7_18325 [Gemmatimonadaceae bacterium]
MKQIRHLVRTALKHRRLGLDTFSEAMADIAKAAGCKVRQARDNMRAVENWGAFELLAEGGGTANPTWRMDGEALFRALVACGCNPHPDLRDGLRGPERPAPPRQSTPAVTPAVEPNFTPADEGNFSFPDHGVTLDENAIDAGPRCTPAVEPVFFNQNHMVKPNENAPDPIYRSLAHTDHPVFPDSAIGEGISFARGTGFREEVSRSEPSAFTEILPLPHALPWKEGREGSTSAVPGSAREACPTACAFAVLRHLRSSGPRTYGAAASDMRLSIGAAWRAQAQLQRIGAIGFDHLGQMVPSSRARSLNPLRGPTIGQTRRPT